MRDGESLRTWGAPGVGALGVGALGVGALGVGEFGADIGVPGEAAPAVGDVVGALNAACRGPACGGATRVISSLRCREKFKLANRLRRTD
jgi:hypothetical protein